MPTNCVQAVLRTMPCFLIVFFTLILNLAVEARPGDFDLTFRNTGFVRTAFGRGNDDISTSALQPDGKLVVVGTANPGASSEFLVTRFNTDGSLDHSFGNAGIVDTAFRKGEAWANSLAIQPDGKIIVVGGVEYLVSPSDHNERTEIAIARYEPDGSLDPSFGSGGKLTMTLGPYWDVARAVALQNDGKLVISATVGYLNEPVIFRVDDGGSVDKGFGSFGIVSISQEFTLGSRLAIQPDGKILAAGSVGINSLPHHAALRIKSDGSFDSTFGNGGIAVSPGGYGQDWGSSILLQTDGKVLVGGGTSLVRFNINGSPDVAFGQDGYSMLSFDTEHFALQPNGEILIASTVYRRFDDTGVLIARVTPLGQIDPSFGNGGYVSRQVSKHQDDSRSIVSDNVGNIIVTCRIGFIGGADTALLGFNADGSTDPSFGNAGLVQVNMSSSKSFAVSVRTQPDGKIVVAGNGSNSQSIVTVARYNEDGTPDTSFNDTGSVITSRSLDLVASEMGLQNDGKIVVMGSSMNDGSSSFAVVRYTPDGSVDQTFGSNGVVTTGFGSSNARAVAGVIQPDGKIVVVGHVFEQSETLSSVGAVRYNPDGSLDPAFGVGGKVLTTGLIGGRLTAATLQQDGKIVVAGTKDSLGTLLIRYNSDGSLDKTFNGTGTVATDALVAAENVSDVKIQSDGKIVVAGASSVYSIGAQIVIVRFNSDGSLDPTLGGCGRVGTSVGSDLALSASIAIQPDGKYLVAGTRKSMDFFEYGTRGFHTIILRYRSDGSLDRFDWGDRGINSYQFDGGDDLGHVELDNTGRILAAGSIDNKFAVARFSNDGQAAAVVSEQAKQK